jgi:L-aspartate-alpha-decarboxylase
MKRTYLKSKIHRATITDADLHYEGSISIDPKLCEAADLREYEKVDIYDINNGARFSTYVIYGKDSEICLKKTILNDKIKTNFCKENNINLLRIPYTEFKNIEKILEETLSF